MCNIAGAEYVGGIAGYGTEITDCHSLVGVMGATACGGAIAGYADMNGGGVVDGNSFVHETLGAIDGISYNGRATPISYERSLAVPGIPDEFRTLTLRFVADGETVKELSFSYGDSIDESEIPAVPEKDGSAAIGRITITAHCISATSSKPSTAISARRSPSRIPARARRCQ